MEKILRLLNPKSTNFDSVGGGSYGALTTQDVCAAISYAELTPVQNVLFRLYLTQANLDAVLQATKMILLLKKSDQMLNDNQQHHAAFYIALVEIFCCVAGYKASERSRAAIGQVSRMQIQRNLGDLINTYKAEMKTQIEIAEHKIMNQLKIT